MTKAAFFGEERQIARVYARGRRETVASLTDLYPEVVTLGGFESHAPGLQEIEVIFSTWGMPRLMPEHLDRMPRLRAVFYAAGSVQGFARPLLELERGVTVVSAWQANAVPVAEFTFAQILLSCKGYYRNTAAYKSPEARGGAFRGAGVFGETVSLLGAGAIGRLVIGLLKNVHLQTLVFDPFLPGAEADALGVEKVSLEDAFARGYVVSNHLANNPETVKMIDGPLLQRLRPDATFINTGRGATVDEDALIRVLQARPDVTALLDVTHPEPPPAGSPLYTLPNVHLTTHIAGSLGDEVIRMADYVIEEFRAWEAGRPLRYAVTPDMLDRMA